MYAKCGSMEDACTVFNKMPSQDAILRGYAMHGHGKKLFNILRCVEKVYNQMMSLLFVFF
jgi:hypothetical protein